MNTQQQSELKVFPREQPSEKNGLGSEFKLIKQKFQQRHQQASPTASSNTSQN